MIKDHINNAHQYDDLHPNFRTVLEILQSLNLDALQPGHIELDVHRLLRDIAEEQIINDFLILARHNCTIAIHCCREMERMIIRKLKDCRPILSSLAKSYTCH